MKQKIFAPISSGWVYRNIFCTGLAEKLAERFDLVFCCIYDKLADEIKAHLPEAEVIYLPFNNNLPGVSQLKDHQFRCEAAVYKSPSRYHILDAQTLHDQSLRYRLLKWLDISIPRPRATVADLREAMQRYDEGLLAYPSAADVRRLLDEVQPDFVWLGTTLRPLDHVVTAVAYDAGLPCVTTVLNWDAVSSKVMPPVPSDAYLVWGDFMAEEMEEYYAIVGQRSQTHVVGSPQYDIYAEYLNNGIGVRARAEALGLDPSRPIIFYGGSNWVNVRREHELVRELVELSRKQIRPDLQWLVRLHPSDNGSRWGILKGIEGVVIYQANPEQHIDHWIPDRNQIVDLVEQLAMSDVVVNNASTITFDACVLNKPVVCVRFEPGFKKRSRSVLIFEFEHFKQAVRSGAFPVCTDLKTTSQAIRRMLDAPNALAKQRKAWVDSVLGEIDGRITDRIISALSDIAQRFVVLSPLSVAKN
jgi:hypothetical protein